jgi:hypothetical protein
MEAEHPSAALEVYGQMVKQVARSIPLICGMAAPKSSSRYRTRNSRTRAIVLYAAFALDSRRWTERLDAKAFKDGAFTEASTGTTHYASLHLE